MVASVRKPPAAGRRLDVQEIKPETGRTADARTTATAATEVIKLNEHWLVRLDDPAQWILARHQGYNADGSPRYRDRAFCTQRRTLLRDIRDYCGDVDPIGLKQVEALPEKFPYRRARTKGS